jgi:hypothetical protein
MEVFPRMAERSEESNLDATGRSAQTKPDARMDGLTASHRPPRRHRLWIVWLVCIVALSASGVGVRWRQIERLGPRVNADLGMDGYYYYVSAAESLLEGRGLDPAYNHRGPYVLFFVPPPMTSWFIAAVYRAIGERDLMTLYHVQAILNLIAGLILAGLLWRWVGAGAALAGYAGWVFYPEFFALVQLPMSENNYFVFLAVTLCLLARWAGMRTVRWALAAAAMIGLMSLQRPNGLFLGVPLAAYALWRIGGRGRWIHAAVFLAVPFLVLLPWMIRNWRMNGDRVWVSSNGGILLYAVNHLGYDPIQYPYYDQYPGDRWVLKELQDRFYATHPEGERTAYRMSKLYMAQTRQYVLHHPIDFLRINAIKFVQRFVLIPDVFPVVYPKIPRLLAWLAYYGLLGLGLAGLIFPWGSWRNPIHQVLAVTFGYYAWFATLMHDLASGRVSVQLRVFLLIFAAAFVARACAWLNQPLPAQEGEPRPPDPCAGANQTPADQEIGDPRLRLPDSLVQYP